MDSNMAKGNTKRLENAIDQLTDEHQSYFLGVLEALNFAQNAREMAGEEASQITGNGGQEAGRTVLTLLFAPC